MSDFSSLQGCFPKKFFLKKAFSFSLVEDMLNSSYSDGGMHVAVFMYFPVAHCLGGTNKNKSCK